MKKRGTTKTVTRAPITEPAGPKATPSIMDKVEETLRLLESRTSSETEVRRALDSLQVAYREISIKNKVDSKREEILQSEILDIQHKNAEAIEEIKAYKQEYLTVESKVGKLENLSRTLSNRVKSVESKANDDVKAEKEDRLRLSYEFSGKIKDISSKLDELNKRRELVISENGRLKDVLRACFEEFDKDPDQQSSEDVLFGKDTDQNVYVDSDEELSPEERAEKQERFAMEREEDKLKLKSLREQEAVLKVQSTKFMTIFDSFQQRLTESNKLFKLKQEHVEEMNKEIHAVEKQNNELTVRIAECSVSAKGLNNTVDRLREEKEKYLKLIAKQTSLIEKFQGDIEELESVR